MIVKIFIVGLVHDNISCCMDTTVHTMAPGLFEVILEHGGSGRPLMETLGKSNYPTRPLNEKLANQRRGSS